MIKNIDFLLDDIKNYYTTKINEYGATPQGVDWKDESSQLKRFDQLFLILKDINKRFTINDVGCGYGKFYDYLNNKNLHFEYYGYDLSLSMINKAKAIYGHKKNCYFKLIQSLEEIKISDYSVASGIFNVKMNYSESDWIYYMLKTMDIINSNSIKGFAFNVLTKYSDKEYMRDDLYYADPCFIFDYCKRNYSKNVSLIHDYDLYEFTILVRKS